MSDEIARPTSQTPQQSAASSSPSTDDKTGIASLPDLTPVLGDAREVAQRCEDFRKVFSALRTELGKVIVGQDEIISLTLVALFADGHVLLEGVPGLGKTLLVSTLSQILTLPFNRIQFTPDLMPADIVGTNVLMEDHTTRRRAMEFRPGPIFAQIILADEVNRATPKTQAALLEAMQERSVTVSGSTRHLVRPFLVLATQNPIEQEGTYTLPEAQLDRFLLKMIVPYSDRKEMTEILTRTTSTAMPTVRPIVDGRFILQAQTLLRGVVVADHVQDYAIRLVLATHPGTESAPSVTNRYVKVGVSPRGVQALVQCAKVRAVVAGRFACSFKDIEAVARPALRHRVMVNFEAEAESVSSDDVIGELLSIVPHELSKDSGPGSSGGANNTRRRLFGGRNRKARS
ncbi:MAG: MoxR family ATPase [Planctomycetes bacterium]|nr:MoxR family ATPase [Planctomycetota bacterium]NOG53285.1 MoxR family ATPase [Planctomycetota bacterium]